MNKTFISRRWAKLTSNVKKRPRIPVTTKLVQRVKSLRQVKRIKKWVHQLAPKGVTKPMGKAVEKLPKGRSEEHTSELQSLMRISYAVFCLKKKKKNTNTTKRRVTS